MALDGASPRTSTSHPVTSVDAGRAVALPESQTAVLMLLTSGGSLADHEMTALAAKHGISFSPQRLRTARSELAEAGRVVLVDGEFRLTKSKYRAQVWALADRVAA
ncbi:hypothetical protein C3B59_05635 [Cryobacterium zongtaii]|uniref:MarR family transcriptional regulator n=1 Tax=Cryobacterium zongtaii TaxID=1259217 RepID=A0A2S3ZLH0_9MICO|nr:hypothetical protein [Cryobacterium zongtaii]POH69371.1 hypothetical protein C3B59_05635 [Cryobacterium zongtaii]